MSEQKKNPLIAGLISLVPTVISTVTSLIKDKREKKELEIKTPETIGEAVTSIKESLTENISSKRVLNIAGTSIVLVTALNDYALNGLTKMNLILIGIGVAYSLGMSYVTMKSERNSEKDKG